MRPKSAFTEAAAKYDAEVRVIWNGAAYNGKSIMELMLVAAPEGSEIIIEAQGPDAQDAINHLEKILQQVEAA
ncbi:MAG: HPr family phosphocarrier protein [Gemmataceae bacterium]|nr:HPr family phosphocarrier protein [Gemmataceae bacterium]